MYAEDGTIIDINKSGLKLFQFKKKSEAVKRNFFSLFEHYKASKISNKPATKEIVERKMLKENGASFWAEVITKVIKSSTSKVFIARVSDITKNKSLEKQLQLYHKFFDLSFDMLSVCSSEGYFTKINPSFSRVLGYSKKELMSKPFFDFVHPEDLANTHKQMDHLRKDNPVLNFRNRYLCKDGSYRMLQWIAVPDTDTGEIYAIARDVTQQFKIEEDLRIAKELAEASLKVKDQFLANISHEMRTPLNAILGFTYLLNKTFINNEQRDFLQTIQQSGETLLSIISDILDFSKIEAGKIEFVQSELSVEKIMVETISMLQNKADEKNVQVSYYHDPNIPPVLKGDEIRLKQILINIINNAIKFTEKGSVEIKTSISNQSDHHTQIDFIIKDTGIGIPKNKLTSVFEPFVQADEDDTRKFEGTGLGLSIVKRLVEGQGGKIQVSSKVGAGTRFTFTLPFKKAKKNLLTVPKVIEPFENQHPSNHPTTKILLVEDNKVNQKLIHTILSIFQIETETAENGIIAIKKLKKNKFDLVLLDIQMPLMDGYTVAHEMRNTLKCNTPIIAMTAHAMHGQKEKCIKAGMDDYISKPFKPEELLHKITQLLNPQKKKSKTNIEAPVFNKLNFDFINDTKAVQEIIAVFLKEIPSDMLELKEASTQKDFNKTNLIAHKIQTSYKILGAKNLLTLARKVEKHSKEKNEILCKKEVENLLKKNYALEQALNKNKHNVL